HLDAGSARPRGRAAGAGHRGAVPPADLLGRYGDDLQPPGPGVPVRRRRRRGLLDRPGRAPDAMTGVVRAADAEAIGEAAALLRAGRLVAFPTETVYGLGADATNAAAIAALYAAKGRPPDNPLIMHF